MLKRLRSREGEECPPNCMTEFDRVYGRLREQGAEINSVKTRLDDVHVRINMTESRQNEQLALVTELKGDVHSMKRDMGGIRKSVDGLNNLQQSNTAILVKHTTEEAHHQARQTAALQQLTRIILLAVAMFGAFAIAVGSLTAVMERQEIDFSFFLSLIGLGGG